jgi:nicotinamidase/pyrazinamidase
LYPDLDIRPYRLILRKGTDKSLDSYSAFFENDGKTSTGLHAWLSSFGIRKLVLAGLATDYCVFFSAMDAIRLGYQVSVVEEGVRAVNVPEGNLQACTATMLNKGCRFVSQEELLH